MTDRISLETLEVMESSNSMERGGLVMARKYRIPGTDAKGLVVEITIPGSVCTANGVTLDNLGAAEAILAERVQLDLDEIAGVGAFKNAPAEPDIPELRAALGVV